MSITFKQKIVVSLLAISLMGFWGVNACLEKPFFERTEFLGMVAMHHLGPRFKISQLRLDKESYGTISRYGKGDRHVYTLPKKWRPSLTIDLRWTVNDWGSDDPDFFDSRRLKHAGTYKVQIPVEYYDNPEKFCVHIFPHGKARIIPGNCEKQYPKGYVEDEQAYQGQALKLGSPENSPIGPILTRKEYDEIQAKKPKKIWR